jgi:ketosteroid isomerase-like protein
VAALVATLSEDVVFENLSNHGDATRTEGRAAFEALARQSARLFSARRQVVVEAVVGTDAVALLVDFEATVVEDVLNGWKAGEVIRLRGGSFFRLRGGQIARIVDLS